MNMTTGREPRGCLQASFVWVCYNVHMECTRILDQLASIGWQGAVKFTFDGGRAGQVIESQAQATDGAISLDGLQDAKALLNIARQVAFTGYIVIYFAQDIRATYVRTQTAAGLDSTMTFERAFAMRSREVVA